MAFDINDAIFDFAYHAAINDATLRNAYIGKKDRIENSKTTRDVVKKYIDDVIAGNSPDFMETAKQVDESLGDENFRFGNIQKLISMTAKYIYMVCYADEGLRLNFECCHCPMDSKMLGIVKREYLAWNGNNVNDPLLAIPVGDGKTSSDFSKISWSNIQFEETDSPRSIRVYENFCEMVKILAKESGVSSIEYDFIKWNP